jgi:hypothetical protein
MACKMQVDLLWSSEIFYGARSGDMRGFVAAQGHLLKDQLEVVKVQTEGRTRYSIKPIEDQLTFDKVTPSRPRRPAGKNT